MIEDWILAWEFTLDEPTVLLNKWQRMHWGDKKRYTERLSWLVASATLHRPRPIQSLSQAWIRVLRGSYGIPPDPDGLIGGLKPLLDVLTLPRGRKRYGLGLICDDSPDCLRKLTAHSVRTRKGEGYTKVTIYGRVGKNEQ